jgi:hypothetical protein
MCSSSHCPLSTSAICHKKEKRKRRKDVRGYFAMLSVDDRRECITPGELKLKRVIEKPGQCKQQAVTKLKHILPRFSARHLFLLPMHSAITQNAPKHLTHDVMFARSCALSPRNQNSMGQTLCSLSLSIVENILMPLSCSPQCLQY